MPKFKRPQGKALGFEELIDEHGNLDYGRGGAAARRAGSSPLNQ